MKSSISFPILYKYPFISKYAKNGLINLNALARLLVSGKNVSTVGMELRRYFARLPKMSLTSIDFSKYTLQLITRTNIHEIIMNKNGENRNICLQIVNDISRTKHFVSIVEGEKEIVVITDYFLLDVLKNKLSRKVINLNTKNLASISIDFPMEMRQMPGIYSMVTSIIAESNIAIHSFHTIGGEILILVRNEDIVKTEEVLRSLLFN